MAVSNAKHMAIVGRCRRIGWDVEVGDGRQDWAFRINCPNGDRVQLHRSPSDVNWEKNVMRQLNRAGFEQAEQEWLAEEEERRQAAIEQDRKKNAAREARAATQSRLLTKAAGGLAIHDPDINWLTTPAQHPETRIMRTTPELAAKLLATINTSNRPMRAGHVAALTDVIRKDEYALTHQGGAVDRDGVLQDGQHRLAAIVEAGKGIVMQWTVGVDPDNFAKVDQGALRQARDVLAMRGEANASLLATAARMLLMIEMHGPEVHMAKTKVPVDRVARKAEEYGDELRQAVIRAKLIRRELKINAAATAAAIYMISTRLPAGDPRVSQFLDELETGTGVEKGDPVWLLRRAIIRASDHSLSGRRMILAYEATAFIIKTWNLRMTGRRVNAIVWRSNEPFPNQVFLPPPLTSKKAS